ncbi:50S ribosomal protein L32 [Candidatus Protochlamydia phocaeensis]|uniref:50S ribosomal protein L32 n=1 Tax=Candidatus Protochlamydia phocaeensis TaxID=1414722 RepID=UPI0009AD639B|nr:50S ribosomal protein L32 [Candidatus Protochlamydia phocaeensis]
MAVPRNRMSNARKNSKRAHHAKKPKNLSVCSNCGTPRLSHYSCQACGTYADRTPATKEAQ